MIRRLPVALAALAALPLFHGGLLAQETNDPVNRGALVYDVWCAHCHDPVPEGTALPPRPGVDQLALKYGEGLSPYITERADLASFEVLEVFLRNGAGSMPPFRRTEITDQDIEALAAYLKHTSSD